MISLKSRLEILYDNEKDREDLLNMEVVQRTAILRRYLREITTTSSALGLDVLEVERFKLSPEQISLGHPVDFYLLQINKPITVRASLARYGEKGSNYYTVRVSVYLSKPHASYAIEHKVCDFYVDGVSEARLYKRVERILKDMPSHVAPMLAE